MALTPEFQVRSANHEVPTDVELESLLYRVYVNEGFTSRESAATTLSAKSVRRRGELLVAVTSPDSIVAGTAILVGPDSLARRLAKGESEAELHLLAVLPEFRRHGVGRRLVASVFDRARNQGIARVLLWT